MLWIFKKIHSLSTLGPIRILQKGRIWTLILIMPFITNALNFFRLKDFHSFIVLLVSSRNAWFSTYFPTNSQKSFLHCFYFPIEYKYVLTVSLIFSETCFFLRLEDLTLVIVILVSSWCFIFHIFSYKFPELDVISVIF